MSAGDYPKLATMPSAADLRAHLAALGADIPLDDAILPAPASPMALPIELFGRTAGNRYAVHPMEGWDGTEDGLPTENTIRRWQRFGESGAKLIWGGEAAAVRPDARANPNQLMITPQTAPEIARLRETLVRAHAGACGSTGDLVVGLQLTHSGRFCRPTSKTRLEPQILYRHPILDRKFHIPADYPLMTDGDIRQLIDQFVAAARLARDCGFDFVDVKHCHGYLGHEFLSAVTRPGDFGGSLENRTRFLREVVAGIRATVPDLGIGVRVSAFDLVPFRPDPAQSRPGRPGPGVFEPYCDCTPYVYGFGADREQPTEIDMTEPFAFFEILRGLDIRAVNVTAGSPYYNPHIQRPALYPPSDGYLPPEDPLIGVARQVHATRALKAAFPDIAMVGTAYTYLQDYLPHVAQAAVREGWVDMVGIGRMVLSYPEIVRDVLEGRAIQSKRVCRTFSDCTTGPRNGLVSGCYPLDAHYKQSPQMKLLADAKRAARG